MLFSIDACGALDVQTAKDALVDILHLRHFADTTVLGGLFEVVLIPDGKPLFA